MRMILAICIDRLEYHSGVPAQKKTPNAPDTFAAAGRRFWREVHAQYELSPAETETLRQACRVLDVLTRLDAELHNAELVVAGSVGQLRANPLLAASAEQRRTLEGLLRSMALPMPGEVEGRVRSPAAVEAAQARWRAKRSG
jgi:hypothetical protein